MIQPSRNKSLLTGFFAGHRVTFARGNISVADTTGISGKPGCAGDFKFKFLSSLEKILASNVFNGEDFCLKGKNN